MKYTAVFYPQGSMLTEVVRVSTPPSSRRTRPSSPPLLPI